MKVLAITTLCLAGALCAQQKSRQDSSYTYDVNGNRVGGRTIGTSTGPRGATSTERVQSLNGRSVPLESVKERVLRQGPSGKTVERIIQRYDQDGRPTPPEKVRVEERKGSGGRTTITTTTYRSDLNSRFSMAEKSTTESTKRGDTVSSTTLIERPSINGSMHVVEKQVAVETKKKTGGSRDVTIYRRNQGNSFSAAARETTQIVKQGQRETTTIARYNTTNSGRLELAGQTISDVRKHPDGSQSTVVNVYGAAAPGRSVSGYSSGLHLREQQLIERRKSAGGGFVENTGVRRTSLSDPNKLGAYQAVSEVVCSGNCNSDDNETSASEEKQQQEKAKPPPRDTANRDTH